MVDFQLDEMQEMLRELAHEFARDEIRPNAEHWDEESIHPKETIQLAHEMGLLNLHIPEAYGGPGLGCMEEVLVNEELEIVEPRNDQHESDAHYPGKTFHDLSHALGPLGGLGVAEEKRFRCIAKGLIKQNQEDGNLVHRAINAHSLGPTLSGQQIL